MRKYKCGFDGAEVDLDNPDTYSYLPDNLDALDARMFKNIGYAYCYMNYFHPDWFIKPKDGGQKKRVNRLIKNFTENRMPNIKNATWYKEQIFLFEDEIENMC